MNKKAVIYARVSTEEQAKKGFSLPSQLEACRKFALDNNYDVVAEYKDDYSGREIDRPGLNDLRHLLGTSQIDALIIYSGDRLTRDLAHSLELRRELSLLDVELCKVLGGQVDDSPHGRFTENVISAVSQLECEMIIERSQRGKNQRAKEGHIIHQGNPPYGYDRIGKGRDAKYIKNDYEAEIITKIFEWYTNNSSNGGPNTIRGIAAHLNEIGVHPPNKQVNSTTYWHPATITRLLKNEIYIGRTYWGKSRIVNKKRVFIPREKWIRIDVPELALINPDIFNIAQKRAKRNRELSKRNRKGEYLLVGYFRCGHCGGTVCGHTRHYKSGKHVANYRCGNHWRQFKGEEKCSIKNVDIAQHKIDNAVWDWIKNLLSDQDALEAGLEAIRTKRVEQVEPKRLRIQNITKMIKEIEGQLRRLIREVANYHDDIVLDTFRKEISQLTKNRDALAIERENLECELSSIEITDHQKDRIMDSAKKIVKNLETATFKDKRRIMDILDLQVTLYCDELGKRVKVDCGIPDCDDVIVLRPCKGAY
jgi:site-specific DNA recombinase